MIPCWDGSWRILLLSRFSTQSTARIWKKGWWMKDNVYDEMEEFVTYSTIIRQGKAIKGKERESSMIRIWYDKMEKSIKKKRHEEKGVSKKKKKKKRPTRERGYYESMIVLSCFLSILNMIILNSMIYDQARKLSQFSYLSIELSVLKKKLQKVVMFI